MAGNADWVIDADAHNLGVSTAADGSGVVGAGADSNPQRVPNPAASGINANTSETYWQGAISAWAVNLVQKGQSVETLPYSGAITYQNASNPQDLSHYSVFVIDEPNILFTATEKTAILNYVHAGGGLFMISDHSGSDRNNDGKDSVQVWNDLLTNNSVASNPFGITYNAGTDVSGVYSTVDPSASDPIIHGLAGTAKSIKYSDGASMTVSTAANPSATIAIHSGSSTSSQTDAVTAYATYGLGHVVAIGDSSPEDDGTGDPNDTLFNGWTDPTATDNTVVLNGSLYLATSAPEPVSMFMILPCIFLQRRVRRGKK